LPITENFIEKIFSLIDHNELGMIDLNQFQKFVGIRFPSDILKLKGINVPNSKKVQDGFEWQEDTIK